ncbi:hypothetical protein FQA47_010800 [Oryzias melastigma]|uniref:Uncharacterized protein n=1 Tax=Oryzias melastigma TaxID=30732 RepID=A0A834FHB9_ORYME|nr:hypothetical protein FQA47_010800 [Oryzias melastigma]
MFHTLSSGNRGRSLLLLLLLPLNAAQPRSWLLPQSAHSRGGGTGCTHFDTDCFVDSSHVPTFIILPRMSPRVLRSARFYAEEPPGLGSQDAVLHKAFIDAVDPSWALEPHVPQVGSLNFASGERVSCCQCREHGRFLYPASLWREGRFGWVSVDRIALSLVVFVLQRVEDFQVLTVPAAEPEGRSRISRARIPTEPFGAQPQNFISQDSSLLIVNQTQLSRNALAQSDQTDLCHCS